MEQVTDRFYSNGEFVPQSGIAVKIRDMLGKLSNPSIQKKGQAKFGTEQKARTAKVKEGTASIVEINQVKASLASNDRSNAARSSAIELCKIPGAIGISKGQAVA